MGFLEFRKSSAWAMNFFAKSLWISSTKSWLPAEILMFWVGGFKKKCLLHYINIPLQGNDFLLKQVGKIKKYVFLVVSQ
jgi:hypothetical protein